MNYKIFVPVLAAVILVFTGYFLVKNNSINQNNGSISANLESSNTTKNSSADQSNDPASYNWVKADIGGYPLSFSYPEGWNLNYGDADIGSMFNVSPVLVNPPDSPPVRIIEHGLYGCPVDLPVEECNFDNLVELTLEEAYIQLLDGLNRHYDVESSDYQLDANTKGVLFNSSEQDENPAVPIREYLLKNDRSIVSIIFYDHEKYGVDFEEIFMSKLKID